MLLMQVPTPNTQATHSTHNIAYFRFMGTSSVFGFRFHAPATPRRFAHADVS
jgi:hypothetical protein